MKIVVNLTLESNDDVPNILELLAQFNELYIKDAKVVDVDLVSIGDQLGLAVTHVS